MTGLFCCAKILYFSTANGETLFIRSVFVVSGWVLCVAAGFDWFCLRIHIFYLKSAVLGSSAVEGADQSHERLYTVIYQ